MKRYAAETLLVISALSVMGGCSRLFDNAFCTFADYEATGSGFRVQVFGGGRVKFGHDLSAQSEGIAQVCPAGDAKRSVIKISMKNQGSTEKIDYEIGGAAKGTAGWTWRDSASTLEDLLQRAGYETMDADEIKETTQVISGVLYGPKGTTLKGQSKFLKVIAVDYRYQACNEEISSKSLQRMLPCGQWR